MSFPLVRDRVYDNPGVVTTSITVTKPALLAPGEWWLVAVCARGDILAFTWPSGWTALASGQDTVGGLVRLEVRYHVATAAESDIVVSRSATATQWAARSWRLSAISGAPQGAATIGNSANANPPNLTPSWGVTDTLWLAIAGFEGFPTISGFPASYDNTVANGFVGPGPWVRLATAERDLNAGSENPGTFTSSTAQWVAATIAIQPGVILSTLLDRGTLTWVGSDLTINARTQIATDPALLTWTAAPLTVNAREQLSLDPATLTWLGQALSSGNEFVLTPMALTWTGVDLVVNNKTTVILDPGDLTWTGQNTTTDRWVGYTGWEMPRISGQTVIGSFSTVECIAIDRGRLLPADQWAEVLLSRPNGGGVVLRASLPDVKTLYGAAAIDNGSTVMLFKYVAGVFTDLIHSVPVLTQGKRLRFEADGATLTAFVDNSPVVETTDPSITTGGYAGVRALQATPDITAPFAQPQDPALDDYAAGDFSVQQGGPPLEITPAEMPWTGQLLTVNAISGLILDAMALTWQGQSLSFLDNQLVELDPMRLTWTGQHLNPPIPTTGTTGGRRLGVNRLMRA